MPVAAVEPRVSLWMPPARIGARQDSVVWLVMQFSSSATRSQQTARWMLIWERLVRASADGFATRAVSSSLKSRIASSFSFEFINW